MTEEIGNLWAEGETLSKNGNFLDALMQFQRAKALLLVESKMAHEAVNMYVVMTCCNQNTW
jgi:hypothetical protein